jgi:hypothetical protein
LFPFADEITNGFTALCLRIIGKPLTSGFAAAIARPATALLRMKSRRFIFLLIGLLVVLEEEMKKALTLQAMTPEVRRR